MSNVNVYKNRRKYLDFFLQRYLSVASTELKRIFGARCNVLFKVISFNSIEFKKVTCTWGGVDKAYTTASATSSVFRAVLKAFNSWGSFGFTLLVSVNSVSVAPGLMLWKKMKYTLMNYLLQRRAVGTRLSVFTGCSEVIMEKNKKNLLEPA